MESKYLCICKHDYGSHRYNNPAVCGFMYLEKCGCKEFRLDNLTFLEDKYGQSKREYFK